MLGLNVLIQDGVLISLDDSDCRLDDGGVNCEIYAQYLEYYEMEDFDFDFDDDRYTDWYDEQFVRERVSALSNHDWYQRSKDCGYRIRSNRKRSRRLSWDGVNARWEELSSWLAGRKVIVQGSKLFWGLRTAEDIVNEWGTSCVLRRYRQGDEFSSEDYRNWSEFTELDKKMVIRGRAVHDWRGDYQYTPMKRSPQSWKDSSHVRHQYMRHKKVSHTDNFERDGFWLAEQMERFEREDDLSLDEFKARLYMDDCMDC